MFTIRRIIAVVGFSVGDRGSSGVPHVCRSDETQHISVTMGTAKKEAIHHSGAESFLFQESAALHLNKGDAH